MNEAVPGAEHQAVRAPHALPAVFAVLGSASLAGCLQIIGAAIDAVANGRGNHTWLVILHSPVTYLRVLVVLGVLAFAVASCAGWYLIGWLRWRHALRAARPAHSGRDSAYTQPELMRSRKRKDE